MCPACMASAALMAGSVMSTGGIAAVAIRVVRGKIGKNVRGKKDKSKDNCKEIERRNHDGNDERNYHEQNGTD